MTARRCEGPDCQHTSDTVGRFKLGLCPGHYSQHQKGMPLRPLGQYAAEARAVARASVAARKAARAAAILEDADWLAETGEHPERIAQRVGAPMSTIASHYQDAGRHEDAALYLRAMRAQVRAA